MSRKPIMIEVESLDGGSVFINADHIVHITGIYVDSRSNAGEPHEDASVVVTTAGMILVREEVNALLRRIASSA